MRLQTKLGGALACVFALLFVAAFGILQVAVTPRFERLEAETHLRTVARIRANLAGLQAEMQSRALDYAHWDETYAYMRSRAPDFIRVNFAPEWFENYNVDGFAIIDERDEVLWRGARDGVALLSPSLIETIVHDRRGARSNGRLPVASGFVWTAEGPILYAAAPSLRSDRTGRPRGLVVMARKLDRASLQEDMQLSLAFEPGEALAHDAQRDALARAGFVAWTDADSLNALIALRAASGAVVGAIRTHEPRAIAALAQQSIATGMALAAAALVIALAACMVLLTRLVSGRIEALAAHLAEQRRGGELALLAEPRGTDEIAALGRAYNELALRVRAAIDGERRAVVEREAEARANQMKSSFIANLSHELRTPLNAIIGYAELLEEESPAGDAEDLRRIQSSARHLLALINEILDMSRIEAGRMEISPHAFDIASLVRQVEDSVRPLAAARGNSFSVAASPQLGAAFTDELRLRQVLLNVLSNACKFTENGRISLTARRLSGGHGGRLVFEISDSGIGMTADQLQRIFEPFMQADASITRRFGGTGLGLAITRKLLTLMGGSIEAQSAPGDGSTFVISLPATIEDRAEAQDAA